MTVNIQSIHFDADKKLVDFITKKVEKVHTYFDGIDKADVYLKLEKDSEAHRNKEVEIKLHISGSPIFAKEYSNKFERATDMAMDKVKSQIKKHKEKLQDKK